jgi:hypothetical protein
MFERLVITGYSIFSIMMILSVWNNVDPASMLSSEIPMWGAIIYYVLAVLILVSPFIAVGVIVWFVAVWIRKGKV